MQKILTSGRRAFAVHKANCPHLALIAMEPRHSRIAPHCARKPQIRLCHGGIVTKWNEARVISIITAEIAQKNLMVENCLLFRSPSKMTVDNGKQFDNQDFREFCTSIGTRVVFASVYHPQSNRVMEIFTTIKKRLLKDKKGKWAEQLPEVLWALNTTESCTKGFTPFRLRYGAKAMTP
jgi:transposase InsO family protein